MRRTVLLAVAVAVVCLGSAGAQTLQPMTSGVIPVVAHLPGAQGSFWTTSLYATQVGGNQAAELTVTILTSSGPYYEKTFAMPAAGGTLEIKDVVKSVAPSLGNGKFVATWWSTQKAVVSTRTFTTASEGTYGQGVGSVAQGSGFKQGGTAIFPAPMDFDGHRVSVGIANAGTISQTFDVKTLDAHGAVISTWTKTVAPGALEQFQANAKMDGAGSISMTCTDGCDGSAFGYASIVVNGTSDAYYLYAGASSSVEPTVPIAVNRDAQGVWYITGGTLYDVFEAMGHEVAKDRLW
ncbi:MAG TPA: hypothetical protein ENK19_02825, partial [Acidobacteria bacterium]|nr:hypothetical protein [Acidobacteriota bacterium]